MLLKEWALANGVHPATAYRWFRDGVLPVRAERVGPRSILVLDDVPPAPERTTAIYARVSSHDQKADLDRQVARISTWAAEQGIAVGAIVTEVGSGLNGGRTKIGKLLRDKTVGTIVVEHRDRLGRMNTELIEAALAADGRAIAIVDEGELDDDLVQDMIDVMTSFCARLYGRRSARNRARRALAALEGDE